MKPCSLSLLARSLLCCVLPFLLAGTAVAQDTSEFERKYQKKLESPFLAKARWEHRLEEACARAKEQNVPIFAYFTRSYAR